MIQKKLKYLLSKYWSDSYCAVTKLIISIEIKTETGFVVALASTPVEFPIEKQMENIFIDNTQGRRRITNALKQLNKDLFNDAAVKLLDAHREKKVHKNLGSVVYGGPHIIMAEWDMKIESRELLFSEYLQFMNRDTPNSKV